ncbi:hypothetical protein ACF3NT_09440 [Naumannella halotolerans]
MKFGAALLLAPALGLSVVGLETSFGAEAAVGDSAAGGAADPAAGTVPRADLTAGPAANALVGAVPEAPVDVGSAVEDAAADPLTFNI